MAMKMFTTKETAKVLRVTTRTLMRYVKEEKLKPQMMGRSWLFSEKEIKKFLEQGNPRKAPVKVERNKFSTIAPVAFIDSDDLGNDSGRKITFIPIGEIKFTQVPKVEFSSEVQKIKPEDQEKQDV